MSKLRGEICVPINSEFEIITARQKVRELCQVMNFSIVDQTLLATAISELARNIVDYARSGEILIRPIQDADKKGILVIARDHGPGIPDLDLAMKDGYSSSSGLGLGLPGCRRIMDEFEISSEIGKGTTVQIKKWRI